MLDVMQEFITGGAAWRSTYKKTFLLVIDKDRKRRESMPALDLRINGERLKTLHINDACRYLGYWGTGNGDMSATSVEDLPKKSVGFSSKAYQDLPPQLRLSATSNGKQRVRERVPNAQGLHRTTQSLMQDYINVVD